MWTRSYIATKRTLGIFATTALIASSALSPAHAADDTPFSAEQTTGIETIIQSYIEKNPQIIVQALENYQMQQEKEKQEQMAENVKKYSEFFQSETLPFAGNTDGAITIVEFYDYNCGYCKRALPDVQMALNTHKDVKVVFVDMPILGPSSLVASQWALAAKKQGKYFEFHRELMEFKGSKDAKALKKIADKLSLDTDQLEKDANSAEIQSIIDKNLEVARDIGINGTPAFIINGTVYPGYLGPGSMNQAIETARGE